MPMALDPIHKMFTKINLGLNAAVSFSVNAGITYLCPATNIMGFVIGLGVSAGAMLASNQYILKAFNDPKSITNPSGTNNQLITQLFLANMAMCATIGTATNFGVAYTQDKIIPFISNMVENAGPLTDIIHKL
jgi:hypothetical protein